jgi:hypothetical protein
LIDLEGSMLNSNLIHLQTSTYMAVQRQIPQAKCGVGQPGTIPAANGAPSWLEDVPCLKKAVGKE